MPPSFRCGSLPKSTVLALAALVALSLAPIAAAYHDEEHGCAATPGAWGAPPQGNNPAQQLSDHWDDVFPDDLVVGNLIFMSAAHVEAALPYSGQGGAFRSQAVALAINIAFGDAGLLDGTLSDVEATNTTYAGWTAMELLDEAERILLTDSDIRNNEYGALVNAMTWMNEEGYGCHEEPPCPSVVVLLALNDGSIRITWSPVVGAQLYGIYRATGDGELVLIDITDDNTYVDSTTAVGQSYSYAITAWDGVLESEDCPVSTTTAVPVFPTVLAGAAAVVGSVGVVVALRRRTP